MTKDNHDIIIYPARWKIFKLATWSLFILILGLFILEIAYTIYLEQMKLDLDVAIIIICGSFFLVISFPTLWYFVKRLIIRKPLIIINDEGIYDNSTALAIGMVKWEEITKIFISENEEGRYLIIVPRNTTASLSRFGPIKNSEISIPESVLPISLEELFLQIGKYDDTKI